MNDIIISSAASEIFTGLEVELKSDTLNYLFNVVKVSKALSSGIAVCTVECEHKSYELNNDEYKLTEFDFEGAPSECLISLLQGTSMTAGLCDPTIPIKLKINRECTRRAALMQLIALCGGEIEYNGNEINIRSHRGSEEYLGIMDGRNVSDLTMETDNRSGTTNYGLTLYKNINFSVGDNVQIVFHPFDLNVNTRIISMSFNPFNRREISIEVGDYRPSISDSLYQLEQAANQIREDVGESTANIKTATNNSVISISEKQQRLFRITFNAVQATYASFCSTVKFTLTTAGTVTFILKKDENEVMRYEEYFSEGSHTKTYAVDTILNPPDYIETGMDAENDRSYNPLRDFLGNLADTAFSGVIVCRDQIPEDGNNMMLPWTNEEVGHAGISNTNTDTTIGTYNENESGRIENGKGYRHVWDFASDKANGEIGCICLTTKDGGTCGMHDTYWELSTGGIDLNSSSTGSFKQTYHTIVGRYIADSEFNNGLYKERIRRAGLNLMQHVTSGAGNSKGEGWGCGMPTTKDEWDYAIQNILDVGFKVFKLDTSNLKTWDNSLVAEDDMQLLLDRMNDMIHRVKSDRSDMDMVCEIMLKLGVPLDCSVGKIEFNGKTAYTVGKDCLLLVCLAEDVQPKDVETMAEYAPAKVIIARDSFADDTAMSNAHYILRDRGIKLKLV